MLKVTYQDIMQLNFQQLTELLLRLLHLEVQSHSVQANQLHVSMKINVSDAGIDGSIDCSDQIGQSLFLPAGKTAFQCKADESMYDAVEKKKEKDKRHKFYLEICKKEKNKIKLKPLVEAILDDGGNYIFFFSKAALNEKEIKEIIEFQVKKALQDADKTYADKYIEEGKIRIYDANKIRDWTNQHLSAITAVYSWIGKHLPHTIKTWEIWSKFEDYQQIRFVAPTDEFSKELKQLEEFKQNENKKIARIAGLSGLGKTRLALETFRPRTNLSLTDSESQILDVLFDRSTIESFQVAYIDAKLTTNLSDFINDCINDHLGGIVVVDNCDIYLHQKLIEQVNRPDSKIKLLTIGLGEDIKDKDAAMIIRLKPYRKKLFIEKLLELNYPLLSNINKRRIEKFSQGFPELAIRLARIYTNNRDIEQLHDSVMLEKLLWGESTRNEEAHDVIAACSLFTKIGFSGEVGKEYKVIAKKVAKMNPDRFYALAKRYFFKRNIMIEEGVYGSVAPLPVALQLAADWWYECSPKRVRQVFEDIFASSLAKSFFKQLSRLDFSPVVKKFAYSLIKEGPLNQFDVLKTEKGAYALYRLVGLHPIGTMDTLVSILKGNKIDYAQLEKNGALHYLIRSIVMLCEREEIFDEAIPLLLEFATNPDITIYGDQDFIDLFNYYNGFFNSISFEKRIEYLQQVLESSVTYKEKKLIINVIFRIANPLKVVESIFSSGISRGIGPVISLSGELDEEEDMDEEIARYRASALALLIEQANSLGELRKLAIRSILKLLNELIGIGFVAYYCEIIEDIFKQVIFSKEEFKQIQSYIDNAKEILKAMQNEEAPEKSIEKMKQHISFLLETAKSIKVDSTDTDEYLESLLEDDETDNSKSSIDRKRVNLLEGSGNTDFFDANKKQKPDDNSSSQNTNYPMEL